MNEGKKYINKIYNEDCLATIERLADNRVYVDGVMTSPPYNMTPRKGGYADTGRYDSYNDWLPEGTYIEWTVNVFNQLNTILRANRVILYNFSYSIENPALPYRLVSAITDETPFDLIDTIIWKKKSGLPFPANGKRLSRNWEYVFVFARKTETNTYENNRKVKSVSEKTGQKYYEVTYNFVEAANNDGKTPINQATYSTDLCLKLFSTYFKPGWVIYDPFSGTGTTAVASKIYGCDYIGSEISKAQCNHAEERISNIRDNLNKQRILSTEEFNPYKD